MNSGAVRWPILVLLWLIAPAIGPINESPVVLPVRRSTSGACSALGDPRHSPLQHPAQVRLWPQADSDSTARCSPLTSSDRRNAMPRAMRAGSRAVQDHR